MSDFNDANRPTHHVHRENDPLPGTGANTLAQDAGAAIGHGNTHGLTGTHGNTTGSGVTGVASDLAHGRGVTGVASDLARGRTNDPNHPHTHTDHAHGRTEDHHQHGLGAAGLERDLNKGHLNEPGLPRAPGHDHTRDHNHGLTGTHDNTTGRGVTGAASDLAHGRTTDSNHGFTDRDRTHDNTTGRGVTGAASDLAHGRTNDSNHPHVHTDHAHGRTEDHHQHGRGAAGLEEDLAKGRLNEAGLPSAPGHDHTRGNTHGLAHDVGRSSGVAGVASDIDRSHGRTNEPFHPSTGITGTHVGHGDKPDLSRTDNSLNRAPGTTDPTLSHTHAQPHGTTHTGTGIPGTHGTGVTGAHGTGVTGTHGATGTHGVAGTHDTTGHTGAAVPGEVKPSIADKLVGKTQAIAGKVTGNLEMKEKGELRQAVGKEGVNAYGSGAATGAHGTGSTG